MIVEEEVMEVGEGEMRVGIGEEEVMVDQFSHIHSMRMGLPLDT